MDMQAPWLGRQSSVPARQHKSANGLSSVLLERHLFSSHAVLGNNHDFHSVTLHASATLPKQQSPAPKCWVSQWRMWIAKDARACSGPHRVDVPLAGRHEGVFNQVQRRLKRQLRNPVLRLTSMRTVRGPASGSASWMHRQHKKVLCRPTRSVQARPSK